MTRIGTGYQNREQLRHRFLQLLSLLAALAVILTAVLLVVYRDRINLARIQRRFSQWNAGAETTATAKTFSYESQRSNVYALAGEYLAVGSAAGLTLYDAAGNITGTLQQTVSKPCLCTGTATALLADLGSNQFSLLDTGGNLAQTVQLEQTIYGADMAANGAFCLLTEGENFKSIVRVYDAKGQELYEWHSASYDLSCVALSDAGDYLAALALGINGTDSQSILEILKTDSADEDDKICVDLGSESILLLDWMGDTLVAFGETQVAVVDTAGSILGRFGYGSRSLQAVAVSESLAAAAFDKGSSGSEYLLTVLSADGSLTAQTYVTQRPRFLSAAGSYVAVTTADGVSLYTSGLDLVAQWTDISASAKALVRSDGGILVVSGGQAALYEPD